MSHTCFLVGMLMLFSLNILAQSDGSIAGKVTDTSSRQPIAEATVTLLDAKDSSLVSFARTDQEGRFRIRGLNSGDYRLLITHIGFYNYSSRLRISADLKDFRFDNISLTAKSKMLQEVTVLQEAPPVTIRKDTIEYNAGSFKTKPNAVVEDLLKKLPGLQVDKDGKIKANGEEVKKVLVDGKEFFGNDPKTATKNLPADIVDKVQVFDKKSEQAAFTGFDDGNTEKTINLTLKPEKRNGLFGRAVAAAGNKERYQASLNINQFSADRQLSLIGMSNNINKQGFSFAEILNFSEAMNGGGRGGMIENNSLPLQGLTNSPGITTTTAGGINYNDKWNSNTEVTGSYFYNKTGTALQQHAAQRWLLPGNNYFNKKAINAKQANQNHRTNVVSDYKIDSLNSLRFSASLNYQQTASSSSNQSAAVSEKGNRLNDGFSKANSNAKGYNWNNSVLYRHRFQKKGRTFSANVNLGINDADNKGALYAENNYYDLSSQATESDTINQQYSQRNDSRSVQSNIAYTEPLSKRSLLQFNYIFNHLQQYTEKQTFDLDKITGKYSIPDYALSNAFRNAFDLHRAAISYRKQGKKYNYAFGLAVQESQSANQFHVNGKDSVLKRGYTNLLPDANFQFDFNKFKNIRFSYNTTVRQPGITDLQPVLDNSDPLNIRQGNPDLSQEYTHIFRMNYLSFDPFRRTNFFARLNLRLKDHAIVYADEINNRGFRITRPVNVNGVYNLNGNVSWGFPIRKLKSNLNISTAISQSRTVSFLNSHANNINNYGISQEAMLTFLHKEVLDCSVGTGFSYSAATYSLQPERNIQYSSHTVSLEMNIYLPKGFSIASDLDYISRRGYTAGYNNHPLIINSGIAKQVFKNKRGELRLMVYDLLNQNTGITRNTNQNYIEDVSYNVLNRYFLLSFTYNISRFAGKALPAVKSRNEIRVIGM